MSEQDSASLRLRTLSIVGGVLVALGSLWLLVLAIEARGEIVAVTADRQLESGAAAKDVDTARQWVSSALVDTDLGTSSSEFSAITLNEANGRLLVADDEGWLFEFDLGEDAVPVAPPRRTIRVNVGEGDIEGIAWMFGQTYVLAHENDGRLTVVEISEATTEVTSANLVRVVDTGIEEIDGNGLEGVAYLGTGLLEFAVVDERPPALYLITSRGDVESAIPLDLGLPDVSDVWVDSTGRYVLLSDEARRVVTVALGGDGTVSVLDQVDLGGEAFFEQPEGVVGALDGGRLFVVGESPGPSRHVFGVWSSEPTD